MKFSYIILVVLLVVGFISGFTLGSFTMASTTTVTITSVATETETLKTYITVEKAITMIKATTIVSLSEKTVTDTITLAITKTFYKTDRSINTSCAIFKTDKDVYKKSEIITLTLKNNCNYSLMLSNSAPWLITDADNKIVYSPIALQVITNVRPGDELKWTWDQRDAEGGRVPPGKYYAKIFTLNAGVFLAEFRIIEV
ncbi:MAG: hypothetical protein QXI11_07905 [Thermoproteota archaeon]